MSIVAHRIYRLSVPSWRPTTTNELLRLHPMQRHRRKRRDAEQVRVAMLLAGIPRATTRRRVRLVVSGPRGRPLDPDAILKSGLDALTRAGAIVDDSDAWAEWTKPEFRRGPLGTVIELEDLA